jgi:hypothetical protein
MSHAELKIRLDSLEAQIREVRADQNLMLVQLRELSQQFALLMQRLERS